MLKNAFKFKAIDAKTKFSKIINFNIFKKPLGPLTLTDIQGLKEVVGGVVKEALEQNLGETIKNVVGKAVGDALGALRGRHFKFL